MHLALNQATAGLCFSRTAALPFPGRQLLEHLEKNGIFLGVGLG